MLVNDTWALTLAGRREVRDLLTLARGLGDEVELATWATVASSLDFLWRTAAPDDRPRVAAAVREILGPKLAHFGWEHIEGEDDRTLTLRGLLVQCLGTIGADESVRSESARRFDSGVVDGDLANAVLATVASLDRPGDFDEMLARFRSAKDPQSENRYRRALAQFNDRDLTLRCFEMCFGEFRLQDVPLQMISLLANPTGGPAVWEQLSGRWDEINSMLPSKVLHYLVNSISTFVSDRAFAERVAEFHRAHPVDSGQRQVEQSIERMLMGVAFAERVGPNLAAHARSLSERRMELGTVLTVFAVIALAEIPDKTMIATIVMGARGMPLWVWLGAACAFLVHVGLAVVAGQLLARLPHTALEIVVTILFARRRGLPAVRPRAARRRYAASARRLPSSPVGTFACSRQRFGVILIGEFGDLTQVLTIELRREDPRARERRARRSGGPPHGLGRRRVLRPRARADRPDRRHPAGGWRRARGLHRVLPRPAAHGA